MQLPVPIQATSFYHHQTASGSSASVARENLRREAEKAMDAVWSFQMISLCGEDKT